MNYIRHKSEESIEDYLETILILSRRLPAVRSIDVANELNFSKPSVSVAMKNLKTHKYITVSEEGYILLTNEGRKLAENIYERHTLLTDWLVHLGVDPQIAASDACKMEHDITPESYEAMKKCILSLLKTDKPGANNHMPHGKPPSLPEQPILLIRLTHYRNNTVSCFCKHIFQFLLRDLFFRNYDSPLLCM